MAHEDFAARGFCFFLAVVEVEGEQDRSRLRVLEDLSVLTALSGGELGLRLRWRLGTWEVLGRGDTAICAREGALGCLCRAKEALMPSPRSEMGRIIEGELDRSRSIRGSTWQLKTKLALSHGN